MSLATVQNWLNNKRAQDLPEEVEAGRHPARSLPQQYPEHQQQTGQPE